LVKRFNAVVSHGRDSHIQLSFLVQFKIIRIAK
jgi:hypothetical protein